MDLGELKELIELLKDTDITDLQVEKQGVKVRLRREKFFTALESAAQFTPTVINRQSQTHAEQQRLEAADAAAVAEADEIQRLVTVTSPLVGTFYRSPSPDAKEFVEAGSRVVKGQVLCIVEAMKLMNEIESEVNGTIVKVLVESSSAVEYGEPLFLIDPS